MTCGTAILQIHCEKMANAMADIDLSLSGSKTVTFVATSVKLFVPIGREGTHEVYLNSGIGDFRFLFSCFEEFVIVAGHRMGARSFFMLIQQ